MDYKELFKHIFKYKWFILIIPIITVVITRYEVKDLKKQYESKALLSTGLADQSKQISGIPDLDFFKTGQQFTNTIEKVKLQNVMTMLSYSLIIHDMEDKQQAFEPWSKTLDSMSTDDRQVALQQFKTRMAKRQLLGLGDDQSAKLYNIVASMFYDEEDINKSLVVAHADGSDFISVAFTSGNPQLSAFVVNTLCEQFIENNNRDIDNNQGNSIALLDSIVKKKELVMNLKTDSLRKFKNASGVLNLDKQSDAAYLKLTDARSRKAIIEQTIQAKRASLAAVDAKLKGKDPLINNNNIGAENVEIVRLRGQLKAASDRYIDNGYKPADQRHVDSLTTLLNTKVRQSTENNTIDVPATRQGLATEHEQLSTALTEAQNSLPSVNREIAELNGQYQKMVPFDANIQNYQREADQAVKDFNDAYTRYNATRTQQSVGARANIAQYGLVEPPQPSKKKIYIILSGLGSFTLCLVVVIALFFLDQSIKTPKQLANATGLPVFGSLNDIKIENDPIRNIWHDTSSLSYTAFKNLLRSIRLDITSRMAADGSKVLGVTSLMPGEGRSFIASCLAYAFAMTGKQVLLIGAETQAIENSNNMPELRDKFENFLVKKEIHVEHLITTLNKNDSNTSLLEIQNSASVKAGFEVLKKEFDIIIIDVDSLREINVAKEWLLFTEKSLAVFKAGREISDRDRELLTHLKHQPGFMGWVLNRVKLNKSIV